MGDKNMIRQKGETNLAIQNSDIYITVSIYDEIERLASEGRIFEVADKIKHIMEFVGTKHPLYPHYRYKPVKFGETTVLEHDPITNEAHEKYPLSYRGQFNIAKTPDGEGKGIHQLIEEAYFKQEQLEINMQSFTTWLGDQLIDTPNLDEAFKDGKWVIVPQKLPEPMKVKIYLKTDEEVTIVDYIELGLCGKENDKYILLDNSRQENSHLLITLKIPINWEHEQGKLKDAKINVKIKPKFEANVGANRALLHFLKKGSEGKGKLAFKNLKENKDVIVAPNFSFEGETKDLEKDLKFIERLYNIESYYGINFHVPEQLDKDDWEGIRILEHAMQKKPIVHNLKKLTIELNELETISNLIDLFNGQESVKKLMIHQTGSEARLELFGASIPIEKVETIYNSIKIDSLDRLKRKFELMEEGESIKIIFLPGEDSIYSEHYYFKNIGKEID